MNPIDTWSVLFAEQVKKIEQIIGKLLYYTCGVDNTCLVPLSSTSSIVEPTEQGNNNINQFLYYKKIHPDAVVQFHASDMILRVDTNALYLTEPQAHSHDSGYFFLWSIPSKKLCERLNGPVHVKCNILLGKIASAAESEIGGCFVMGRDVIIF